MTQSAHVNPNPNPNPNLNHMEASSNWITEVSYTYSFEMPQTSKFLILQNSILITIKGTYYFHFM